MLVPYVMTYELEPPSCGGARKNQAAASVSTPAAALMRVLLRTCDDVEAVRRRGGCLRRGSRAADAPRSVRAGVPGAGGDELDLHVARRGRADGEVDRVDVRRRR